MKITEIIAHPLSVALEQGRWTAHEFMERAQIVLVEVRTDQGIVGFGEIAGGPQNVIVEFVKMFSLVVQGMDPLGHTEIWTKLFSLTSPRPGGLGGWDGMPAPLPRNQRPQIMAAIGGIDIALWDIKGKAAGLPVFRILGGTRTEVFTYATGGVTYLAGEPLIKPQPTNSRVSCLMGIELLSLSAALCRCVMKWPGSARSDRRSVPMCCSCWT